MIPDDFLADFAAQSSLLMQSTAPDGRLLWANEAWKRALGYSDADIADGLSIFSIMAPESRAHCELLFRDVMQGNPAHAVEAVFITRGGDRLTVEGEANARMMNGQPVSTRAIFRDITTQVNALRVAEDQLRRFVRSTPAAMAVVDTGMRYLAVSDRWLIDYLGHAPDLRPDDLIGRSHYDVFPEVPEAWRRVHERCLAGAVEESDELPLRRPDGRVDWIRRSVRPWYSSDGNVGGLIMFGELVTRRVIADAERRQLAAIVSAVPDIVVTFRNDLTVAHVNPAGRRILANLGDPATDSAPASWTRLSTSLLDAAVVQAVRREATISDEINLPTTLGVRTFLRTIVAPRGQAGEGDFIAVILRDITSRRRMEGELRRRQLEFETLAENAPAGIARVDEHRRLLFANRIVTALIGLSAEELIGRSAFELGMPDKVASEWDDALGEVLATGAPRRIEFELLTQRGFRSFIANINPDHGAGAERPSALFVLHDVTERRKAERYKEELIGVVSHELRSPVTVIRGSLQMLDDGAQSFSARDRHLVSVGLRSANRLLRLINDLLDVERLEAGMLPLTLVPHASRDIVSQSAELVRPLADERGIALDMEGPDVAVTADLERAVQVLVNLLGNAVKFSPAGSRVNVRWGIDGHRVCFTVQDHGRGIPADRIENIFGRFAQAADGDREGGTGLGLAIARAIVEQHGGRIWAESEPGSGSRFHFDLPGAT